MLTKVLNLVKYEIIVDLHIYPYINLMKTKIRRSKTNLLSQTHILRTDKLLWYFPLPLLGIANENIPSISDVGKCWTNHGRRQISPYLRLPLGDWRVGPANKPGISLRMGGKMSYFRDTTFLQSTLDVSSEMCTAPLQERSSHRHIYLPDVIVVLSVYL